MGEMMIFALELCTSVKRISIQLWVQFTMFHSKRFASLSFVERSKLSTL
jgi:hypothetical protein